MQSYSRLISSPIGEISIISSANGICRVELINAEESSKQRRLQTLLGQTPMIFKIHLDEAERWLEVFFDNPKNLPSPPELDLSSGGEFAQKVWRLLASSEVGETFNYSEIASALDNPKASRAVGTAMANNPLPLLVPCHRVLPKSGDLGNYSALGGVKTKQWLLTHESPP